MTDPGDVAQSIVDAENRSLIADGRHPCEIPGCPHTVQYDDEPYCFGHSPDEGSYKPGYSYRRDHPQTLT